MIMSGYRVLYNLYFISYKKWKVSNKRIWEYVFRITVAISHRLFPTVFTRFLRNKANYRKTNPKDRNERIVASLTTFPARIELVWISISTILLQSVRPDIVELWLAKEQFPGGIESLPKSILRLRQYGLEICFCDDDLRSHKKYYYSMQKHPKDVVITFDDDFFYPFDSIEQVWKLHQQTPLDVIGMSTPVFTSKDLMNPLDWEMQNNAVIGMNNLGIYGGCCSLFPPCSLHTNAFDKEAIKNLAPLADDLWLTAMTYMNGKKVSSVGRIPFPVSVQDTQCEALYKINNIATLSINNNTQWTAILDYYKENLSEWIASVK